jgi:hypothetical protein
MGALETFKRFDPSIVSKQLLVQPVQPHCQVTASRDNAASSSEYVRFFQRTRRACWGMVLLRGPNGFEMADGKRRVILFL